MRIIRHIANCPLEAKGGALTLGNFDGVHLGHQYILKETLRISKSQNIPSLVMTFEPHPVSIFKPDLPPSRITPFKQKMNLIGPQKIKFVALIRFSEKFSKITAREFIDRILIEHLNIKYLIVGHDLVFGHKREGNSAMLKKLSLPFKVIELGSFGDKEAYSSTRIRKALQKGEVEEVKKMLGRYFEITGIVMRGEGRGKNLGFPTANIALHDYVRPKFGVYRVNALINGIVYPALANLGKRPTFRGKEELLEVHIPGFNGDLYGKHISVVFLKFMREEKAFRTIEELKAQIEKDVALC